MKTCTKCKQSKELLNFKKESKSKDGLSYFCKPCAKKMAEKYNNSKKGVVTSIYGSQKRNSKKRGHNQPTYTKQELSEWLLNDWLFNLLYDNWVNCGYIKSMKPSVDRINDNKGYLFGNIQIMTWGENNQKGHRDIRFGKLKRGCYSTKAVLQFTKSGVFVREFISASEAKRIHGYNQSHISQCCQGKRKSTSGFMWKFKH